jgi:hypothetical protein
MAATHGWATDPQSLAGVQFPFGVGIATFGAVVVVVFGHVQARSGVSSMAGSGTSTGPGVSGGSVASGSGRSGEFGSSVRVTMMPYPIGTTRSVIEGLRPTMPLYGRTMTDWPAPWRPVNA